MKRRWVLRDSISDDQIIPIQSDLNLPRALIQVLYNRGIRGSESVSAFLTPVYGSAIYDPFILPDMKKGVERVVEAIEKKEPITIYADYDADAVTAAAVMLRALNALGVQADYYIPDRFSEGYGMNPDAIAEIARRGTKLIITVDCGITAVDEVAKANELGMDVLVTDHHHVPEILPDAVANINPHRGDSMYPFKDLTGVGVAFKFVQALFYEYDKGHKLIPEGWEKWLLDLVAIGTVADCQSLLGENRILVKYGLQVLQKTRWPGLKALISISGLDTNSAFSTYTIGFQLAPRLNAAGRLAHADLALKLLLTDDALEAADLALKLENLNRQRQKLTETIMSEAREQVESQVDRQKILFAYAPSWPKGVVGLVAGRLTESFYRPVLVGSQDTETTVGSARSIPGFSIIDALTSAGEHTIRFGGHSAAAGFTVSNNKIEDFHRTLNVYADANLSDELMDPVIYVDAELRSENEISLDFAASLEVLAPFGQDNTRPLFLVSGLVVENVRTVGAEGKHAQVFLKHGKIYGLKLKCIAFSKGFLAKALKPGDIIDVVGELTADEWNGNRRLQVKLVDWRKSE